MRPLALALFVTACASPPTPYYCSALDDAMPGAEVALCHDANAGAVCDTPGMTASYHLMCFGVGFTYELEGGTRAVCDGSNHVVCTDPAISPHCVSFPSGSCRDGFQCSIHGAGESGDAAGKWSLLAVILATFAFARRRRAAS